MKEENHSRPMPRRSARICVLLCDWEGTLVDKRGQLTAGAQGMLDALHEKVRLVVASNAPDCRAIDTVLERTGVDGMFAHVATAGDLGTTKPSASYYRKLLTLTGTRPRQAAMVGDDYVADITGAKCCGLRAVWYNPYRASCPTEHPVHDHEVGSLAEVPEALARRPLPDIADCMSLLSREDSTGRLAGHSLAVAAVAYRLATELRHHGVDIDGLLVHRGALLHDLDKLSTTSGTDYEHGRLAGLWLRRAGQEELAKIAEQHVASALLDRRLKDLSWETKVVHYADKLVEENKLVGLDARWRRLLGRYPQYRMVLESSYPRVARIGEELEGLLGRHPEHVVADLSTRRGSC